MATGMLKPVYLRNSDIVQGSNPVTDYELLESVLNCTSEIKCIQRDRGLWRIYVNTTKSRDKLLTEGFTFEIHISMSLKQILSLREQTRP